MADAGSWVSARHDIIAKTKRALLRHKP
jgi:hypothetical protein